MRRTDDNASSTLIRMPIMPLLGGLEHPLCQAFVSPLCMQSIVVCADSDSKRFRLGSLLRLGGGGYKTTSAPVQSEPSTEATTAEVAAPFLLKADSEGHEVQVPNVCAAVLRPHQREGVIFVFRCLLGLSEYPPACIEGVDPLSVQGCILADDMGLGKTLQSISVLWTLLQSTDRHGVRLASRVLIVCPASLVGNWDAEIVKWLHGSCQTTAVTDSVKAKNVAKIDGFRYDRRAQVLVVSYETLRINLELIRKIEFQLVICDEAHKLKNKDSIVSMAVASLPCQRRLLLTGTPLQNDLEEFCILAGLTCPAIFTGKTHFKKHFVNPILAGTRPNSSEDEISRATGKLKQLAEVTNAFILRRANQLLRSLLPPKVTAYVFCGLSGIQKKLYVNYISLMRKKSGGSTSLTLIQNLCKICTHPLLVPMSGSGASKEWSSVVKAAEFDAQTTQTLLQAQQPATARGPPPLPRSAGASNALIDMSGKFSFLFDLLRTVVTKTDERFVVVSNFTQSLDLVQKFCQSCGIITARLDGGTTIKNRHKLVEAFNVRGEGRVFLLSSKAGGAGINLIGANRLVLMDPDWNPANDKQALARVWREGQLRQCIIYRLFSTNTVEEKILQRQLSKDNISSMVVDSTDLKTNFSSEMLKALFDYSETTDGTNPSSTHQLLNCARCTHNTHAERQLLGDNFTEDNLATWSHALGLGGELARHDAEITRILKMKFASLAQSPVSFTISSYIANVPAVDENANPPDLDGVHHSGESA